MSVSVLIPAFRPTFLVQAIASVLCQGFTDYELLINDDSVGDEVAAVVERFRDPRIRYTRTAGDEGGAENTRQLWKMARYDLVKLMYDDDILLPHALQDLVDLLAARPEASFAFGHRDIIDAQGRIRSEPRVITAGKVVTLSATDFSALMIPGCRNPVGEFPNVLINRRVCPSVEDMFEYSGFEIEMLADVAFYLNASKRGPGVGIGRTISQYRKHENQNSTIGFNPIFFKGIFEWELFLRGEHASSHLSADQVVQGIDKLYAAYGSWGEKLPELHILRAGLGELKEQVLRGDRDALGADFRRRWDEATAAGLQRAAKEPSRLGR